MNLVLGNKWPPKNSHHLVNSLKNILVAQVRALWSREELVGDMLEHTLGIAQHSQVEGSTVFLGSMET